MANSNSTKGAADQSRESYADDAKARRVTLVDAEGVLNKLLAVTDENSILLSNVLVELRKMNLHMCLMTDNEINNEDVETNDN